MNICFILGKVISKVEFKFIYNSKDVSISIFKIMLRNKSTIECMAYNDVADYIYRNVKIDDMLLIEGKIHNDSIEILKTEKVWKQRTMYVEIQKISWKSQKSKAKILDKINKMV